MHTNRAAYGMRAFIWLPLALVAGAPNIIYVVVDDLDQMLGSSFPQTTAATPTATWVPTANRSTRRR